MKIRVVIDLGYTEPWTPKKFEKVCTFARFPVKKESISAGRIDLGEISNISHEVVDGGEWVATAEVYPPHNFGDGEQILKDAGFVPAPSLDTGEKA